MFNYDKLEKAIKESGKTKTYLCQKINRPAYYLRDVIKQKNAIPPEHQQILADELGVTVEWLNDEETEKPAAKSDGLSKLVLSGFRRFQSANILSKTILF